MNNVQLNIIANAQFQQVYAEVAKLKEAMLGLQKASVGGPFTASTVSGIKQAQQAFDNAVLSTRAFNIETVAMGSNIEKFGKQLQAGQLSINQYYKIWRDNSKGVSQELDNLATSQARLNRSIAIADPLRPGYAKLVTDINGVVTAQEKAIFYQQALNTALNQGATKLIDFGKNMQWAGRQMTVGLTVPLALFANRAAQTYLSFDQQMTSMLKVYGAHAVVQSQQTLDAIRKDVTNLATELAHTIGVTMTDTVEIAKTFSAIGLEGQDLIKTTQATATLMKLGDLQATNAAQSMVALQNVFKLQSNQMQDAVNFLNAAKHSTSTTMQDIIDAIPRVGPILQQMGGTYKDFVTLLVGMRESGVPAAQAANAIKSMFASIENPTSRAVKLFDSLGINLKSIVSNDANNPLKMIMDLQKGLDNLPSLSRQQAIENLFGKFQFARVEALLNNLGKTGSQTQKVLELYGQSTDQLAAVAKQEIQVASDKTPAAQYAKMKASLQADLIPLGQTFLQVMTKLGNLVDKIVKGFNHLGAAGKILMGALTFMALTGPLLMLTGLFSNFVGQMLKGANYIRMFKQGMENATPSQNKFLAGIHNLTNFYRDLDKTTIAARNQMELMPEAITSNAKAFEILRKSILDLTTQFTALTVAQREAMGGTLVSNTLNTALGTAAEELQMRLPGFAFGGIVPGTGNKDSYAAMLTPGEVVVPKEKSKRYSTVLSQILTDTLPGYNGGTMGELTHMAPNLRPGSAGYQEAMLQFPGLVGFQAAGGEVDVLSNLTARLPHDINAQLRDNIAKTTDFEKAWTTGSNLKFSEAAVKGGLSVEELKNPKMQLAMKELEDKLLQEVKALDKNIIGDNDVYKVTRKLIAERTKGINGSEELNAEELRLREVLQSAAQSFGGYRTRFAGSSAEAMLTSKTISKLPSATSKYEQYGALIFGETPIGEYGGKNPEATRGRSRHLYSPTSKIQQEIDKIRLESPQTIEALLQEMKRSAGIASPAERFETEVGVPIVQGVAEGMKTGVPQVEATSKETVKAIQQELDFGMQQMTKDVPYWFQPMEEEALPAGQKIGQSIIGGMEEELSSGIAGNRISTAFSKLTLKAANLGVMGRMGIGSALMMAGSMAGSSIGGTAGTTISNVSNFASMGMMFSGQAAAVGAALGGISSAIDIFVNNAKKSQENWSAVVTTSATDLTLLGGRANTTNLQVTTLSDNTKTTGDKAQTAAGQISGLGGQIAGLGNNFGSLTGQVNGMISAINQLPTTDPLKTLITNMTKQSDTAAVGNLKTKIYSDLATGQMDPSKIKPLVLATLTQAGKQALIPQTLNEIISATGYKETLDKKGNVTGYSVDLSKVTAASLSKLTGQQGFKQTFGLFNQAITPYSGLGASKFNFLTGQQNIPAKAFADQVKNLVAAMTNGSMSAKDFNKSLLGLQKSSSDNQKAFIALQQVFTDSTATSDQKKSFNQIIDLMKKSGVTAKQTASDYTAILTGINMGMTPDKLEKWAATARAAGKTIAKNYVAEIVAWLNSPEGQKALTDANTKFVSNLSGVTPSSSTTPTSTDTGLVTTDYSKLYKNYLNQTNKLIKVAQDQANAQKKYNDELKATQDYHNKQLDYLNQMKNALTTGNYLGAVQAQASAQASQADFLATQQEQKQTDLISYLQNRAAMIQDAIANQLTPKQFAAANKGFDLTLSQASIKKLFGMSDIQYGNVTNKIIGQTAALQQQAVAGASGAVFGDVTINISGSGLTQDQLRAATLGALTDYGNKNYSNGTGVSGTGSGTGSSSSSLSKRKVAVAMPKGKYAKGGGRGL